MNNNHKIIALIGLLMLEMVQNSVASVVSTGDFDKDFFVIWSPSHVNTSTDGQTRSLKLDQESGTLRNTRACWTCKLQLPQFFSFSFLFIEFCLGSGFSSNQMFLFGKIDMQIKLVPGDSAGTVVAYYVCDLFLLTCCVLLLYYCFS